jgi:predicted LPLAT superfamily acyltransferase
MAAKPAEPAPPRASGSQWAAERERGSTTLLRVMIWVAVNLGRRPARLILYFIAGYFFAFAPAARRNARHYLRRALGREPTARDRFRQVFAFASTILDRLYLVRGRFELLEVTAEGEECLLAAARRGRGALLLGAHLGSFEMMSAVGLRQPGVRVAVAMYEDNANRVRALFHAANSACAPEIIPLGHLEAMLRIRECLSEGAFVGMLADRTVGDSPAQVVNFLGSPALFPSGPMRAAAAMRCEVVFITCLYRGGNRYHVVCRPLADFSQPMSGGREASVRAAIERYVSLLEEYCRSDPWNWFNFYDFWHGAPPFEGPAPPSTASAGEARGASV